MDPKRVTVKTLEKVMDELMQGTEAAIGNYLYKGMRVQISQYRASGAQRYARLYHRRRLEGLCVKCGAKVRQRNPSTGKLYRLCDTHRQLIDRKSH